MSKSPLGLFSVTLLIACHAPMISANAQSVAPRPGDRLFSDYLAAAAKRLDSNVLAGAATRAEWEKLRPRLHQEYMDMLGLWPLPKRTPLQAKMTGNLERAGVLIEKWHFQSMPGLYVTGNLYRPKNLAGKLPAVLYVCGHTNRKRNGNKTAFQDHGLWFANNGYVCLVIDTLQLGEIPGVHHGTYSHGRWWWHARGYASAGVECWNGVRALDFLLGRPDVDTERVTVTGISGGGAATLWVSAADERVRCAVPVSGMSDLESYVANKIVNGHCDCMLMYNTYQWEWTTIAALVAPRPMLFANSDNDSIFPMDGNKRIVERLRKLYRMYDKPDQIEEYVSKGGHAYRPDLRVAVFQFVNRHNKQNLTPVRDANFEAIKDEDLRVFPEDKDVPSDARNATIDESFVPMARPVLPENGQFDTWRARLVRQLRERSFRTFPDRVPRAQAKGEARLFNRPATLFETEPGVSIAVTNLAAKSQEDRPKTLLVITEDSDKPIPDWAQSYAELGDCTIVSPRGFGVTAWTKKSPPNYVERAHVLVGNTVDERRVWDIAAVARALAEVQGGKWRVVGRGQGGILGAYAALFERAIDEVVVVDPPASHKDGPFFLNVLRILDTPDALGLLAPKKLRLVNARNAAFDRTAEIYRLAGSDDRFQRE